MVDQPIAFVDHNTSSVTEANLNFAVSSYSSPCSLLDDCTKIFVGFMGTTPPTYACAVRFMNLGAETKFEKGASDRNSPPGVGLS